MCIRDRLKEAATDDFKNYARQIITNAKILGDHLQSNNFNLVTGGTDNHLLLIDLNNRSITGRDAADALERAGIVTNFNSIPFADKPVREGGGIRLGTPAITSRGLRENHMSLIAEWITRALNNIQNEIELEIVRKEIQLFLEDFPAPGIDLNT